MGHFISPTSELISMALRDPQANFQELLHYCREVLGGGKRLASQRELAEAIDVAATMAGRYIAGGTDPYQLRATTLQSIARAAGLDVGTVYIWLEQGRAAAMAHQERLNRKPLRFTALDYVREAAALLERQQFEAPPQPQPDYEGLEQALAERRGPDGDARTSLFDTLVDQVSASQVLERIVRRQSLSDEDWLKLQMLLGVPAAELQHCYGFGQSAARTEPQPA